MGTEKPEAVTQRVRIPLQSGTSAARDMIFMSGLLLPLLAIGSLMVGNAGRYLFVHVLLLGSFGGLASLIAGLFALQRRATDLELGVDAMVVRKGASDGVAIRYGDIEPSSVVVVQSESDKDSYGKFPEAGLDVRLRDGRSVELARIMDLGDERFYLEEIQAIIVALASSTSAAPAASPVRAEVLACDACGRPVVPAAAETVTCGGCHQPVRMPEEVRRRIESHRSVSESELATQSLVQWLLRQPRADEVNWMLYAFFSLSVALPYVCLWGVGSGRRALSVTAYCLFHVLYQLIRRTLARRVGFRSLVLFAKSSRVVGEERLAACRNCGALLPLPEAQALVVHCAYCGESSLLGIDIPWQSDRIANARFNLGKVLSTVAEARSRCNRRLVILGLVLAVMVPSLIRSLS